MPFFVGCLAIAFPRFALFLVWFFGGGYVGRAYDHFLWPVLGFLFFPLTTLAFAFAFNSLGAPGAVPPFGWLLVGLAVLGDIGLLGSSRKNIGDRRRRNDADE